MFLRVTNFGNSYRYIYLEIALRKSRIRSASSTIEWERNKDSKILNAVYHSLTFSDRSLLGNSFLPRSCNNPYLPLRSLYRDFARNIFALSRYVLYTLCNPLALSIRILSETNSVISNKSTERLFKIVNPEKSVYTRVNLFTPLRSISIGNTSRGKFMTSG